MGVIPLGSDSTESVFDGHKFSCGIYAIQGPPIVYSFGSFRNQEFELAFLRLRPDAKIYVFEIDPKNLPPENVRHERIKYHSIGIGYENSTEFVVK